MLIAYSLFFVALCLLVGRDSTAKSVVSLSFNIIIMACIVFAIYFGMEEYTATIIGCIAILINSLFYQNGYNVKTKAAFVSVIIILIFMTIMSYVFVRDGNWQGFPRGEYAIRASNGYGTDVDVSMSKLMVCTMMIAVMGAITDTALAITSPLYEVWNRYEDKAAVTAEMLYKSGVSIGRDILSSTINTLVFIFLGESILFFAYFKTDYTWESMINSKLLVQDLGLILISAIGCILVIPTAAIIASKLYISYKQGK